MLAGTGLRSRDLIFSDLGLESHKSVVVAVSGGSDSIALLWLLKEFVRERAMSTRLVAVTVDHGLREEAAVEALWVARSCEAWSIAHRTVRWTDAKHAAGLAEVARLARYRLLADAALASSADLILTGHTFDDQAETVAMREARGAGRGLAGMAPATRYDGRVWIVRPLLAERREWLRKLLRDAGIGWIDDPSNSNDSSERVRIRGKLASEGGEAERLARLAFEAAVARRDLGRLAASVIDKGEMVSPGLVRLPASVLAEAAGDHVLYAFRILMSAMGGTAHLASVDNARMVLHRLRRGTGRATLSRALADHRKSGLYVLREQRGLPGPRDMQGGEIWDGRFRLAVQQGTVTVAAACEGEVATTARPWHGPPALVALAHRAEPCPSARTGADGQWGAAGLLERVVSPWALFLPDFDIAPCNATARLIGAPLTPCWPQERHNSARHNGTRHDGTRNGGARHNGA